MPTTTSNSSNVKPDRLPEGGHVRIRDALVGRMRIIRSKISLTLIRRESKTPSMNPKDELYHPITGPARDAHLIPRHSASNILQSTSFLSMKHRTILALLALSITTLSVSAADKKPKAKAYPLDKCLVSDEKFEGSGMEAHEFVHEGQTIKLCCKSCLKDFKKDTATYLKKLPKSK